MPTICVDESISSSFLILIQSPKTSNVSAPFGVAIQGGAAKLSVDCKGTHERQAEATADGCMVGVSDAAGPLLPLGTKTATIHAYVDHSIVETIFNNRTAMVTYSSPADATSTGVALFGVVPNSGVKATITTWNLATANNDGPQP